MSFLILMAALIGLLYLGLPMFAALFLLPLGVLLYVEGGVPALGEIVLGNLNGYLLVAIPLFMMMAHVMVRGRVVDDLYGAAFAMLRNVRGGVGIATVVACTVFAAICGSSVATALTIGKIAIPQMLRQAGIPCEIAYKGNLKRRMERANKIGAQAAIIIGEAEVAEGVYIVRNLADGSQDRVDSASLLPALAAAGVEDAMLEQMMENIEAGLDVDEGPA